MAAAEGLRQRQESVYAAEDAALGDAGRVFRDLGEVRAYVDELVASDWWADRWPHIDAITVGRSRSRRFAGYAVEGAGAGVSPEIRIAGGGALREPVLLHEIAHVVSPGAGHGPAFVSSLVALVRERLGFHRYGALLAELRRRNLLEGDRP
jgi:putative metallohydrolase (TIGR04338 family)